jgi:uncharacterized membrane protein
MLGGFHWFDLVVPLVMLIVLVGVLVVLGWSIGAGFAWMRRRQEQHPDQP